jgi:hypothetical protein
VTSDKKRWRAEIYFGGMKKTLGTFGTREEAAFAYDVEARQCISKKKKHVNFDSIEAAY